LRFAVSGDQRYVPVLSEYLGAAVTNPVTIGTTAATLQGVRRRTLLLILVLAATGRAADPAATHKPSPSPKGGKLLHVFVAAAKDGAPTKNFLSGNLKIYGLWKGDALKAGDTVRAVWVAESFGYERKDVKITEGKVTAYKRDDDGIFSLARPTGGWPIGSYRLELYVGDKLADTVRFTIEEDVTVEVR
jgi:hypothetical protein